jgi:hypothetical protein
MERAIKTNQAYYETPWRKQLKNIGLFLACLVLLGLIAGVYLSVNAKAAIVGRQVQNDRFHMNELENEIADKQSQLAILTSAAEMEKRAFAMGFFHANSDEILYLVIEGYHGKEPAVLASEVKTFVTSSAVKISPEYTESLYDWLYKRISLPPVLAEKIIP